MVLTGQILFTNKNELVYRAGQTIEGIVKYTIDKPTEFTSVTLSLRGKGICDWTTLFNRLAFGVLARSYTGTEDYVMQTMDLLQAKENQIVTLQAGSYEHPFRFELPEELPSNYKDITCNISYYIILKFTKPSFMSSKKKFYVELQVQGGIKPYLPEPLIAELRKEFSSKTKCLTIKAEVERTFLIAGENIKLSLIINNDSEVPITAIKAELVKYLTYKSDCRHEKHRSKIVKGSEQTYPGAKEKTVSKVSYDVPTLPRMYSVHTNILVKEYRLKVTANFGFPHKEAFLEIPVVIVENIDDLGVEKTDGEQPPSYWQVMSEDKGKAEKLEIVKAENDNKRNKEDTVQPHSSKT